HRLPAGRQAYAGGLGRDERLEIDQVQQRRLDDLRLEDRPGDADQRLVREDGRPFGHRVQVAGKAHGAEVVEERRIEQRPAVVAAQAGEVGEVVRLEAEAGEVVDH